MRNRGAKATIYKVTYRHYPEGGAHGMKGSGAGGGGTYV